MQFRPPIELRETEELVVIAFSSTDEWHETAIKQAKAELAKRNISEDQQLQIFDKIFEDWEDHWKEEFKQRETEDYTLFEKIMLTVKWPYTIFSDWGLKEQGYFLKYKRRLQLIFLGIFIYVSFFTFIYFDSKKVEKQKLEEIKNYDISDWEKKYYPNN